MRFDSRFMALLVWICGAVLFYEFEQAHSSLNRRFKERVWNEGQSCNGWCLQGHCGSPGLPSLTSKVFREEQVAFNAAVTAIEGSSVQHVRPLVFRAPLCGMCCCSGG